LKALHIFLTTLALTITLAIVGTAAANTTTQAATTQPVAQTGTVGITYHPGYSIVVWDSPLAGRKSTGKRLKAQTYATYTHTLVGADGNTWYQIGAKQWISTPFATGAILPTSGTALINYVPGAAIAVWSDPNTSHTATGKFLKHGAEVKFQHTAVGADGLIWYQIGPKQWISSQYAGMIDTHQGAVKITGGLRQTSAAIWTSPLKGGQLLSKKLNPGTTWKTFKSVIFFATNTTWYNVGGRQWINANDGYMVQ